MPARNVRGRYFTIIVDDKRIFVEHCRLKGKRFKVSFPEGVSIESCYERDRDSLLSSTEILEEELRSEFGEGATDFR